jgi:DNA-binding transcriptional ArsR family regulator
MSGAIDLIFGTSEVRRQILAAFYAGPGLVTHARELARRLGHPSQVVGRELQRLEDAGILTSETVGRVRRYRVNAASPIAADVRGLVLRTIGAEALDFAPIRSPVSLQSDQSFRRFPITRP